MLRWTSPRLRTLWRSQVELEVGDTVSFDIIKFSTDSVRELILQRRFPCVLIDSFYNAEQENLHQYHYAISLLNEEAELERPLYDELREVKATRNLLIVEPPAETSNARELRRDLDSRLRRREYQMSCRKWLLPCWYTWVNGFVFTIRKQIRLTKIVLLGLMCVDKRPPYLLENTLKYWRDVDRERLNPTENRCIPIPHWLTDHIDLIGIIYTHMDRGIVFLESLKQTHSGSLEAKDFNLQTHPGSISDNEAINSVVILLGIISEALDSFYLLIPDHVKVDIVSDLVRECHPIIHDHIPLSDNHKSILMVLLKEEGRPINVDKLMSNLAHLRNEGYKFPKVQKNTVNGHLSFLHKNRFIFRCSPNGTINDDGRNYILSPTQVPYVQTIKLPNSNEIVPPIVESLATD